MIRSWVSFESPDRVLWVNRCGNSEVSCQPGRYTNRHIFNHHHDGGLTTQRPEAGWGSLASADGSYFLILEQLASGEQYISQTVTLDAGGDI
eukprot:2908921-Rhodomonas_salina.1